MATYYGWEATNCTTTTSSWKWAPTCSVDQIYSTNAQLRTGSKVYKVAGNQWAEWSTATAATTATWIKADWEEHDCTWRVTYDYRHVRQPQPPTPSERLRGIMASRQAPAFLGQSRALRLPPDIREQRARQTLRRVIGDDRYRDFLRKGHVSVRGPSGLDYQIFPGHGITKVYEQGKLIERLCVVLTGDFPATDSVIMRYLLILNDETMFRAKAIRHSIAGPARQAERPKLIVEPKRLTEIYRDLKLSLQA